MKQEADKISLPDFVETHIEEIKNLWMEEIPEVLGHDKVQGRTREYIENSIPDLLKTIAQALRDPYSAQSLQYFEALSKEHVEQRLEYFDISFAQLIKEYGLLRDTIMKYYVRHCTLLDSDSLLINKILDNGLCQATAVYLEKKHGKSSQELMDDNANLVLKNEDLKRFTTVAAHDLKAPLVTITGYLSLLRKELFKDLEDHDDDARLKSFLAKAEDSAAKLFAILDAVLRFSRLDLDKKWVELGVVIEMAIANLDEVITSHRAEIIIESDLPMVCIDKGMMAIVFQNILANALKYRSNNPPVIKISGYIENGKVRVCFEDNGIGIAEQDLEKIFQPFVSIGTNKENEQGLGLGLSTSYKIVERHNGSIGAESDGEYGARFWIELPAE